MFIGASDDQAKVRYAYLEFVARMEGGKLGRLAPFLSRQRHLTYPDQALFLFGFEKNKGLAVFPFLEDKKEFYRLLTKKKERCFNRTRFSLYHRALIL